MISKYTFALELPLPLMVLICVLLVFKILNSMQNLYVQYFKLQMKLYSARGAKHEP
jgi:hypothetical protein